MRTTSSYVWLSLSASTIAQTFSGFTVQIPDRLNVLYGNVSISNGQQLPRADVLSPPNISYTQPSSTGRSVLIMIDSDVPSNGSRTTLLHWIAPNITSGSNGMNSTLLTLPPSDAGVAYAPPNPPQGDYPHRYSFLLYEQPQNFSIPSSVNASARRGFDLQAFIDTTGLSTGLAANYMLVANVSGPATTSFPPPIYTATSTLASSAADATPAASSTSGNGSGASGSATISAASSGATATASAGSTAEGSSLRAGSGVALLAAIFGMLLI